MKLSFWPLAALMLVPSAAVRAQDEIGYPVGTSPVDLGLTALSNEPSREDLFTRMRLDDQANDPTRSKKSQTFALSMKFRFPADAINDFATGRPRVNSIFGVDISHHQTIDFPIEMLAARKVDFLYMKASQGTTYVDDKFSRFWARAGRLPKGQQVHRGAYHFLTAGDPSVDAASWGTRQAATFLKVFRASNPQSDPYRDTDMPPVMDLEWDRANGNAPDRWKGRTPAQIIAMTKAFLAAVAAGTGRRPVIYTAQSWWHERIGADARQTELAEYPLWLADYTEKSRMPETPRTINNAKWALWQFTEKAELPTAYAKTFDANIFKGPRAEFFTRLGVKEF